MKLAYSKTKIVKHFSKAVVTYDAHAALAKEVSRRLLEKLQYIRCRPATILDLGAGTGVMSQPLRRQFPNALIASLDLALPMLMHATHTEQRVCADMAALPFTDHSIDLVISNLSFAWDFALEAIFTEIQRVLAPGGLLLFSTFGPDTLKELRSSWAAVDNDIHVHPFFDMHDVGDVMLRAGFSDPVTDVESITVHYDSVLELLREIKYCGCQNALSAQRKNLTGKNNFKKMQQEYAERYGISAKIPASFEIIYGHAWGQNRVASDAVRIPLSQIGFRRKT